MSNTILLISLVLVVLYYRYVITQADFKSLEHIEFKDLKTGDIWCGRSDFTRWPELWHAHLFFTFGDCVNGIIFSHCGVVYRDPSVPIDRGMDGLYIFMTQNVPYPDSDPMSKYPFGQSGTFLMPMAVAMHQYTENTITPIKKAIPDDIFQSVMDGCENLHHDLATTIKEYAMLVPGYLFGLKFDACKSLCMDHVAKILKDSGVVNINRPVVHVGDLYSDGGPSPFYFHFSPDQGFEKSRRVGW